MKILNQWGLKEGLKETIGQAYIDKILIYTKIFNEIVCIITSKNKYLTKNQKKKLINAYKVIGLKVPKWLGR